MRDNSYADSTVECKTDYKDENIVKYLLRDIQKSMNILRKRINVYLFAQFKTIEAGI